jgi:carbonic anhydrase
VQDSWKAGLPLTVHGWVYGLTDGIAHDLGLSVSSGNNLEEDFEKATERILAKCKI